MNEHLPDGIPPVEEEISIGNNRPVEIKKDKADKADINHMRQKLGHVDVLPSMSEDELLQQIIATPEEQLIPWEECTLPSRGLYYGWQDGTVIVKAMSQKAEKILATQRLAQTGQSLDYLFRECCQFPGGFDPSDLLLGDRIFLLYYIRGITYGNMYEFAVTCANQVCGAVNTHQYDLNELSRTITWADPSIGFEPFKIVLPYLSQTTGREVWAGVRFLRASDANQMIAKRKGRNKIFARPGSTVQTRNPFERAKQAHMQREDRNAQLDETINENLEAIIMSVNGVTDRMKIKAIIGKLHSRDTTEIREWLRIHTPGIDNTVNVTCPDCDTTFTVELPITDSFFRPSNTSGMRENIS